MPDREKLINGIQECDLNGGLIGNCPYKDILVLLKEQQNQIWEFQDQVEYLTDKLKEQENKQITLHKKHVITWGRSDKFSMRKLYEAICETLLDEGELFIARTDNHEKVDFVFYVAERSVKC